MPEIIDYLPKNYETYISNFSKFLFEYSILSFRWYIGFLMTNSFVNTHVLIDWLLEIALIDYVLTTILQLFFSVFFPEDVKLSSFFAYVFPRMIAIWVASLFLHQSLLLLLFSQTLYWLFTIYSKLFLGLFVESLTMVYYFSNWWFILPILINLSLSFLYIIDLLFSTENLYFFLNIKFINYLLDEWGFNTDIQKKLHTSKKFEENIKSKIEKFPGLSQEENFNYHVLKERYLHEFSESFLMENFEDLKAFLAQQYYKNQAYLESSSKTIYLLPLEWLEFTKYRLRVPPQDQVKMFKTYFLNDAHCAWRLLSKSNPWISTDKQNIKLKEQFFDKKNLEFIITIWLSLKSHQQDEERQELYKIKIDIFIKILSRFNRFRNIHADSDEIMDKAFDDEEGDKLGNLNILYPNLLSLVIDKQPQELLSESLLNHLLHSFSKSIWILKLSELEIDEIQNLKSIWEGIVKKEFIYKEHHPKFLGFNFSKFHKDDFLLKMNTLFGRQWLDTDDYLILINTYFNLADENNHSHPFLNPFIFLEAIHEVEKRMMSQVARTFKP